MRSLILVTVLALAACSGENGGWNPNYKAHATPYGDYLRARENALMGRQDEPPRIIPVALPIKAPTAAEIAGPSPVQMLERGTTEFGTTIGLPPPQRRVLRPRGAPAVDPHLHPAMYPAAQPQTVVAVPVARTQTVVVATPAPQAPLLVRYAAANGHNPGTRVWQRGSASNPQACAAYADAAAAQTAFIMRGGPAQDPMGLDADGDGYVCGWNPAAYRQAAR
ncbi:hypothetical protein KTN05_08815 [Paracoccus sp. Z118]|uniref:hypothetical protein n=1 Tax=Paracoccus sp. Z118 TaxID=2851017 RepID=UPI001C2B979D|nr:hypothetical protein [Paracoccus sp. Z118]MBV0891950.1 hypothetical protein [Paracoccus sp. Z118]